MASVNGGSTTLSTRALIPDTTFCSADRRDRWKRSIPSRQPHHHVSQYRSKPISSPRPTIPLSFRFYSPPEKQSTQRRYVLAHDPLSPDSTIQRQISPGDTPPPQSPSALSHLGHASPSSLATVNTTVSPPPPFLPAPISLPSNTSAYAPYSPSALSAPSAKKSPPATLPSPLKSSIVPKAFVRPVSSRARASSHTPPWGNRLVFVW